MIIKPDNIIMKNVRVSINDDFILFSRNNNEIKIRFKMIHWGILIPILFVLEFSRNTFGKNIILI